LIAVRFRFVCFFFFFFLYFFFRTSLVSRCSVFFFPHVLVSLWLWHVENLMRCKNSQRTMKQEWIDNNMDEKIFNEKQEKAKEKQQHQRNQNMGEKNTEQRLTKEVRKKK